MRILLWTTAFVGIWWSSHALLDYCSHPLGSSGSGLGFGIMMHKLNAEPPPKTRAFLSQVLSGDGQVTAWEVFAAKPGTFYAMIWRRDGDKDFVLVGKNKLTVENTAKSGDIPGYQIFEVPGSKRISVRLGDFIGIGYAKGSTDSIVYVELSSEKGTNNSPKPGPMVSIDLNQEELDIDQHVTMEEEKDYGLVTLRALITGISPFLKLENGRTPREGWAYLFRDNVWGSICDKWFKPRGWPLLMCYSMGYPDVDKAWDATQMNQPEGSGSAAIHFMNIRCKPSDQLPLFTCDKHINQTCGHDKDIYIKCQPKVRILTGGIPQSFECGYWGLICDTREPEYHYKNRDNSWVTAFCRELGKNKFISVERAKPSELSHIAKEDTWKNPDCDKTVVQQLMECKSKPLARKFCHEMYYKITCG